VSEEKVSEEKDCPLGREVPWSSKRGMPIFLGPVIQYRVRGFVRQGVSCNAISNQSKHSKYILSRLKETEA